MNISIAGTAISLLVVTANVAAAPVTESRAWTERYPVDALAPQLSISNIWGNVRVRPGGSGEITVTVDERRTAPDQALFERSLDAIKLNVEADNSGVSILVGGERRQFDQANMCRGCRVDYQFEVLVPTGTQLDVGTVLDGTIDVAGVVGVISASNVNGPINVSDVRDCQMLESVNGEVEVSFTLAPGQDCNIETINGDITVALPSGSGVDVALDLFNGRMVSEFSVDPLALPATVEHTNDGDGHRYRIQQSAGLRLEGGGPMFSISSLNGDIRIQKTQ